MTIKVHVMLLPGACFLGLTECSKAMLTHIWVRINSNSLFMESCFASTSTAEGPDELKREGQDKLFPHLLGKKHTSTLSHHRKYKLVDFEVHHPSSQACRSALLHTTKVPGSPICLSLKVPSQPS